MRRSPHVLQHTIGALRTRRPSVSTRSARRAPASRRFGEERVHTWITARDRQRAGRRAIGEIAGSEPLRPLVDGARGWLTSGANLSGRIGEHDPRATCARARHNRRRDAPSAATALHHRQTTRQHPRAFAQQSRRSASAPMLSRSARRRSGTASQACWRSSGHHVCSRDHPVAEAA